MPSPYLSIVLPTFNGAETIPSSLAQLERFVSAQPFRVELVLVDDGSELDAARILSDFAATRPWVRLLRNDTNRGKGAAVTRGMLAAVGRYRIFTDADLAYPVCQIRRMLTELEKGADVVVANRVHPDSRYTMSPSFFSYLFSRHLMSRAFNAIVRASLLPRIHDTQAGLKGFTKRAARQIFAQVTVPRFGFDIELLVAAREHGLLVVETPVDFRYDDEPTTVRFTRDCLMMLRDLVTIRLNRSRGAYTYPPVAVMSLGEHQARRLARAD